MEFNIGDLVALYGNFIHPCTIVDKGHFFSESSPNNEEILYKLSSHPEAWYSGECLNDYNKYSFDVKVIQEECHLCKKYGKPSIISGYCMGFVDYMEPTTIIKDRYCGICGACIENK